MGTVVGKEGSQLGVSGPVHANTLPSGMWEDDTTPAPPQFMPCHAHCLSTRPPHMHAPRAIRRVGGSCHGAGAQCPHRDRSQIHHQTRRPRGDDEDTEAPPSKMGNRKNRDRKDRPKIHSGRALAVGNRESAPRPPSVLPDSGDDDFLRGGGTPLVSRETRERISDRV